MMKLPWKRVASQLKPRPNVNPRLIELEIAKQILEEIFHARPSDAEEMIKIRLDEKSWNEDSWREEDESWPASFSVDE